MRTRHLTAGLTALLCAAGAAVAQVKIAADPGRPEAPFSLTTADGTGLALVELDARAVVDGPLAFTELRMTFANTEPRVIEGHFQVTMPEGAAISRFAMKISDAWMEGEVVEKQAARRAYEDALHRRQDPALLEQDAGNSFRARVFPIPANGRKELIVSWSHELKKPGEAYRLPLLGLPRIEKLSLTALTTAEGGGGPKSSLGGDTSRYQVSKVQKSDFTPDQDWVLFGGEIPASGDARRNGNLAVARFIVPGASDTEQFEEAVVLLDTSASRAVEFEARLARARLLINGLEQIGTRRVRVIAFDQYTLSVYEGAPSGFGDAEIKQLLGRRSLGATNLGAALDAAALTKGDNRRVLLLSDGMVTAGEREREALRKLVAALADRGIQRLDAVVDTTARDAALLEALATAPLARPGQVIEGRDPLDAQLARLSRKALGDIRVDVDGSEWVWPEKLRGVQGGDAVVVFADVQRPGPLAINLSGGVSHRVTPTVAETERPLLERAWVAARINRLEDMATRGDRDLAAALRTQIIALSTRHRVLSQYTALVVLETEADYRRFNIDRRALADILTVGPSGLEVASADRGALAIRPPPPPPPPPVRPEADRRTRPVPAKTATARAEGGERAKKSGARPRAPMPAPKGRAASRDDFADGMGGMGRAGRGGGAPAAAPAPEPAGAMPMDAAPMAAAEADMDDAEMEESAAAPPEPRVERSARREATTGAPAPTRVANEAKADDEAPQRIAARRPPPPRPQPDPFPGRRPPPPPPPRQQIAKAAPTGEEIGRRELREIEKGAPSLLGELASIDAQLSKKNAKAALAAAEAWRDRDPADLLALVALGRSYAATGDGVQASRSFGSIIDLYPSRADMRRMAGGWLAEVGMLGMELARDTFAVAAEQRPDHPSVYHQLAMTLTRLGRHAEAIDVLTKGLTAERVHNRFPGVDRILQEDIQLIGAVWAAAEPDKAAEIRARLQPLGLVIDDRETLRFVLTWETDANDVDFHIFDGRYNHAYYSRPALATGGELFADVTTGYGPECFSIHDAKTYPYRLKAHYYRKGPMGHGAGAVQVIRHDGKGNLGIEDRPFVIMQDGAYVDLGTVTAKTAPVSRLGAAKIAR